MSVIKPFVPWENEHPFEPSESQKGSGNFQLQQWPIKLWKSPVSSPYYHRAHLLVCADCVAFAYANLHQGLSSGRIPLICCPESDYEITTKLTDIIRRNDIQSITVIRMDDSCCADLTNIVMAAIKQSHKAVPMQTKTVFIECEIFE